MWGQGGATTHLGEEAEEAAVLHFFVHLRAQRLLVPLGLSELSHHAAGDQRDGVVDGGRPLGAAGEAEEEEVAEVGAEGGVDVRHALVEHLRGGRWGHVMCGRWGHVMYAMLLLSTCGSAAVRCWVAREMSSRASAARSSLCWIGSGFRT